MLELRLFSIFKRTNNLFNSTAIASLFHQQMSRNPLTSRVLIVELPVRQNSGLKSSLFTVLAMAFNCYDVPIGRAIIPVVFARNDDFVPAVMDPARSRVSHCKIRYSPVI
jgi:hypothetical protein